MKEVIEQLSSPTPALWDFVGNLLLALGATAEGLIEYLNLLPDGPVKVGVQVGIVVVVLVAKTASKMGVKNTAGKTLDETTEPSKTDEEIAPRSVE